MREPGAINSGFDDYWQLRMEGATARLKAAQQIVSHPGTRGNLAENLLRELIRDFLPHRWTVATGFVVDSAKQLRSHQVDVLVYDQLNTSPIFRDGELVILPPNSARVAIEVKSQLNKNEIFQAYGNISSVRAVDPEIYGFVFGYHGVAAETFAEHVAAWNQSQGASPRNHWPDQVFNLGRDFLIPPPLDATTARTDPRRVFPVVAGKDPIMRMLLTATLTAIGLTELRAFFREDDTGDIIIDNL